MNEGIAAERGDPNLEPTTGGMGSAGDDEQAAILRAARQVAYALQPAEVPAARQVADPFRTGAMPVVRSGGSGRKKLKTRKSTERYHPSIEQLEQLVASFEENPSPSVETLNYLSESIAMPMVPLVLWFKNRRSRSRSSRKGAQRVPGTRRSYVKSGVYSLSRRPASVPAASSELASEEVGTAPPYPNQAPPVSQPEDIPTHQAPVEVQAPNALPSSHPSRPPQTFAQQAAQAHAVAVEPQQERLPEQISEDPGGTAYEASPGRRPMLGLPEYSPPSKRVCVRDDANGASTCRSWSSLQCLRAFVAFFERTTGGYNPEQTKAASAVAELFFLGEMQSGLTVTSVAQPLEVSLQVLEELLARGPVGPGCGDTPLSSGSRAVLGEFIAQIRSGEAAAYAPPPVSTAGGVQNPPQGTG